jgi:hypothetical protein
MKRQSELVLCPSAPFVLQVRVNFLSQLLPEGRAHLQTHLTASVLCVKVFELPFHRGVQVTANTAAAMMSSLAYCQKVGDSPMPHENDRVLAG